METGLAGKVALITGGTGAIGRACGRAFAAEGAAVAIADLDGRAAAAVAEVIGAALTATSTSPTTATTAVPGTRAHDVSASGVAAQDAPAGDVSRQSTSGSGVPTLGLAIDVSDEAAVGEMVQRTVRELGRLDVLVNCAGIFHAAPFAELAPADWRRVLDVNLTGMFLCCQAAMRVMRAQGGGRIINFGSLAGQVGGFAAGADYSVSKAGVICLTKSLARALAGSGVTVNTINPGPVEGPMVDAWPPGQREIQLERMPVGRFGRPEEIAAAVVFLASDLAGYIHGAHLDINGGLLMD